jgi:hypothetical protein
VGLSRELKDWREFYKIITHKNHFLKSNGCKDPNSLFLVFILKISLYILNKFIDCKINNEKKTV